MAVKPILTNRELKNKLTGIDLHVSDFQEIPHRMKNSFLYHVIVITNLFYYKTREHRESDIVQFMISKTFEEFEELYDKLYKRFPSVIFPSLPGKSLLSKNVNAKLQCMDEVLKMVASTQKLCCSPMVISFLKGDAKTTVEKGTSKEPKEKITEEKKELDIPKISSDISGFEEINLFESKAEGEKESQENFVVDNNIPATTTNKSIFDDVLEDETESSKVDELFVAHQSAGTRKSEFEKDYELDDDLLDVSDDLDELLSLSKTSEKQSSIKVNKPKPPTRPRPTSQQGLDDNDLLANEEKEDMFKQARTQSFKKNRSDSNNLDDIFGKRKGASMFDDDDGDVGLFSNKSMAEDDILSYIQEQEKVNTDEVRLDL